MRLSDHLRPERVLVGLIAPDRASLLEVLGRALADSGVPAPAEALADLLARREEERPTVLGNGIAVPHASLSGLAEPVVLVAVTSTAVVFGDPVDDPVRIFFTLLTPPDQEGVHVRLLARICRIARHAHVRESLGAAVTPESALALLLSADALEG
jgi:nitrogen PTS system EIIA component